MNWRKLWNLFVLLVVSPIAFAFVVLVRLIRPLYVIRFGVLKSDRIGHFVLETELMLQEQRLGLQAVPKRGVDLYYSHGPIANLKVEEMWSRVVRMPPRRFMVATYKFNRAIPGGDRHVVPFATSTCLDVLNLLDQTSPLLSFTKEEHELGQQLLESLGVGSDPFVCVIVRDEAYYKVALPDRDLSYHSFRNCDIDSYVEGLEALAEKGLFVVRMGAVVEKPLRSSHPKLIDYASSSFRSEFGDVYLGANCKFCISDGLGYYAIPAAFRRPNAYVNYSPFHIFYSSRSCDVGITKVFSDSKSGRVIPVRELHEFNVSELTRSERLAEVGLHLIDNSPSEIRDLILEMNSRLDGTWLANPEDEALQSVFWERYLEAIGPIGRTKHGYIRSRFGAQFLREHREWIA